MKICILGGGFTGITAYRLLKDAGHDVFIIEAQSDIGGLSKTYYKYGCEYEFGPHILYTEDQEVIDFLSRFIKVRTEYYISKISVYGNLMGEGIINFPPSWDDVKKLKEYPQILEDYNNQNSIRNPKLLSEFAINNLGNKLYELIIKNYTKKRWGVDSETISCDWCSSRPFIIKEEKNVTRWDNLTIRFRPDDYNKLAKDILKSYDDVLLNTKFLNFNFGKDKINSVQTDKGNITADFFVNTLPLDIIFPEAKLLKYRAMTKVYYLINRKVEFPYHWITFPNNYKFCRLSNYNSWCKVFEGKTLVSFSYQYDYPEGKEDVNNYISETQNVLSEKMGISPSEYKYWIHNEKRTSPVPQIDCITSFEEIIEKLSNYNNIITMGHNGLYNYISVSTCIKQCIVFVNLLKNWDRGALKYFVKNFRLGT